MPLRVSVHKNRRSAHVARNSQISTRVELPRAADDRVRRRDEIELQVGLQCGAVSAAIDPSTVP